jgi:hypothetical protein
LSDDLTEFLIEIYSPSLVVLGFTNVSFRLILKINVIVTWFPAGQFSAPFDFVHGVPSNAHKVFGSIGVINSKHRGEPSFGLAWFLLKRSTRFYAETEAFNLN